MLDSAFKEMITHSKLKVGTFLVEFNTPGIGQILKLDNVIVTPHGLCWSDECFAGIGAVAIAATFDMKRGEKPRGLVNHDIVDNGDWQAKMASFKDRFGA